MTLTISLPPESAAQLQRRAEASGVDVSTYVSKLLQHFTEPPAPLEELSGPIHDRFRASGMTEDQLAEELERAKHEMRAERRVPKSS